LYGFETSSFMPWEECRMRLSENRTERRIKLNLREREKQVAREKWIMRSFIICILHKNIIRMIKRK